MPRRARLFLTRVLVACLPLAACERDDATPVTEVIVDIDAEAPLRASIAALEIHVAGSDTKGDLDARLERLMQTVRPGERGEPDWPVRLAFTPRGGDAQRVFELAATALDGEGEFLAAARLITGYVKDETRYARLLIEASCLHRHCGELETCRDGLCIDAWLDPDGLASFAGQPEVPFGDDAGVSSDAGTPDAGGNAGAGEGPSGGAGSTGMQDAGGASSDAGAPDGGGGGDAGTPPPDCRPGVTECRDDVLFSCSDQGRWDEGTPCAYVCSEGECSGECVPDSKDCLEGVTPRHCDAFAQWVEEDACPAVCIDGTCAAACEQGSAQCSGNDLLSCESDGTWSDPSPCEFLCDPDTDACIGECTPDAQQCVDEDLQRCGADASWAKVTTCPFVCEPDPSDTGKFRCGGVCVPGSTRCDSATELAQCNASGTWNPATTCTDQACVESDSDSAACVGECSPGTRQCGDNVTLEICDGAGSFGDTDCALQDQACVESSGSASCSGSCAPGTQQCSGNKVQTCSDAGAFADAPSGNCTNQGMTCMASGGTAACGGECAPGQVTCTNNDAYGCNAGTFTVTDDCTPPNEICESGACVANDPYAVGQSTAGSGFVDFSPSNDFWYVIPIQIPTTANVQGMRMIVRTGVAGAYGRMALWEDAAGVPGAFVAQTNNILLSAAGEVSAAPVPLATQVTGGHTYWLGAKFTGGAQLYRNTSTTRDGYFYGQAFATNPSTSMNPFPIGSAGTLTDVEYNFFLFVQDVSQ